MARVKGARWVSRRIQRITGSWYSHAMIALGDGRYAHAVPKRGGTIELLEGEEEMGTEILDRAMHDLYRPKTAPDPDLLMAAVEDFRILAEEFRPVQTHPCGGVKETPGMLFSDGSLLVLALLKGLESDRLTDRWWFPRRERLRNALLVTANDSDSRLFCSEFVHRVLDRAGARPAAPPRGQAFIDLGDLPTDEPKLETMGADYLFEWIRDRLWALFDFDQRSLVTCSEVVDAWRCHYERRTPVPVLELGNFLTPSDLSVSPSLRKISSRYRLVNGADSGWVDPLPLPPFPGTSG